MGSAMKLAGGTEWRKEMFPPNPQVAARYTQLSTGNPQGREWSEKVFLLLDAR